MFANGDRSAEPEHALELARNAEALGFESLWAVQHVVMPVDHVSKYPYSPGGAIPGGAPVAIPDPFVWLAYAAAVTTDIRLATGVVVLPQQHALVVAKQVATLDRLSGGRVILGVGAGWLREEFEALGAQFEGRGGLLDEQIEVLRAAWSDGNVEHVGPRLSFAEVAVEPKPIQKPVPVVIGGHTKRAIHRAARIGDGFFPLGARGDALAAMVGELRRSAIEFDRDPDAVEVTADAPRTAEQARTIRDLGVHRVIVNAPAVPTTELRAALEARLADVARLLRED
jgi:probable F420-dependent oxidoreductase